MTTVGVWFKEVSIYIGLNSRDYKGVVGKNVITNRWKEG